MSKKNPQKDLNITRVIEGSSKSRLKPLKRQDSLKMEQLQGALEKLSIDEEKTTRKKRTSPKSLAAKKPEATKGDSKDRKGTDKKNVTNAKIKKKSMSNNDSSGLGESHSNKTQKNHSENQLKRKYVTAKSNKKIMEKSSDKNKNTEKISEDTIAADTNVPTTSDKNHTASRIPLRVKRKGKSSHKNLSKQQNSSVNKENTDINTTIILPKGQNIIENEVDKLKIVNKSRKIDKTFLISAVKSKENVKIIESSEKINCLDEKEMGIMNLPSKIDSPVIIHVKCENQSSQSPIAGISKHSGSCPTPPSAAAARGKSVDIKKYEKSSGVEARNLLIAQRKIKREKNGEKVVENIGDIEKKGGNQLSVKNLAEGAGCSSMELDVRRLTYTVKEEEKEKPQAKDTGKNGEKVRKDSTKKCTCNEYEERLKRKKEKKLARAFEKLGKTFVVTAKKMGYLSDSTEDSLTDDSEDYSEHSTDCSCSSCTSYSDSSSRSSDDFSEFTVSGSSSDDSTADSSSTD